MPPIGYLVIASPMLAFGFLMLWAVSDGRNRTDEAANQQRDEREARQRGGRQ